MAVVSAQDRMAYGGGHGDEEGGESVQNQRRLPIVEQVGSGIGVRDRKILRPACRLLWKWIPGDDRYASENNH
jgi:hypothetical protein